MPRLSRPGPCSVILPAAVLLILLIPAARARAGFLDYDTTRARLAVQRAEYLLGDAQYAADVARSDFEQADRRAADLAREIDRQQRDVDDASRRLDEADRSSKWLREEVDRCNQRVDARRKELDAASERLRATRAALDKLVDAEADKFEAGEQFKGLSAAVDEAGKALEAAEKASLQVLAQTDEHRAAKAVVDAIQTRVEFLTQQGDRTSPDELAAAKRDMAEAQDRLRRLEDRHLSADPNVKAAETKVAQAESARRSAREDFEKRLDQRPEIADARKAEAAEQEKYDNALRTVRDAEARAGDANQQLAKQDEAVALEQDRLRAANDQLNRLLGEVREADDFATAADQRLRDALDAVECARRERDAASWSLARADWAPDAFYGWGVPATGCGWSVVHVGFVDCAPRPVFYDPLCYRPVWCRPLTAFHRPYWHAGFAWGGWWGHHPKSWVDDGCRPVVVKVTRVRVHNPVVLRVRETAREQAVRLASRNSGEEQRRQRQATVEARRQEVAQRQVRLASFGPQAGTQGAAAIAARQAAEIERRQRQQAAAAPARGQAAAEKNGQQQTYAAGERTLAQRRGTQRGGDGSVVVKPSGTAVEMDSGKRLRWEERREAARRELVQQQQARREREQKQQAEVANRGPAAAGIAMPPVTNAQRADNNRDDRNDAARQASAVERAADQQAQQQRRAERDAAQQARAQQEAQAEQARRQQRQQEVAARAAREQQRDAQQDAQRDGRESARRQDEQNRRQAAEMQRQQETEARRPRQADDSSRDAARQQAAAEERSRRDAMEQARSAQREAQRDAARQAEQQRSAEREAARSAERSQRQAESESRRSSSDERSSRGNSGGSSNDRSNDSGSGRGGRGR